MSTRRRKSVGKWPAKTCDLCGAKTKKGEFDASLMPFGTCPHCKSSQCFPCVVKGAEQTTKPMVYLCCKKIYKEAGQGGS